MVAPNPQVRIAPSGPLAGDTGGDGLDSPLAEMMGARYRLVDDLGGGLYVNARLGPSNAPADRLTTFIANTNSAGVVPNNGTNITSFAEALNGDNSSADFEFGKGAWLFEAELACGYNTSLPSANEYGVLQSLAALVRDNGSPYKAVGGLVSGVGRGVNTTAAVTEGSVRMVKFQYVIEVDDTDIAANAGEPFKCFQFNLFRSNGTGLFVYTANSGWLEFLLGASYLSVRRFR